MTNQAAQTMPECTCRDNEGCTKPCDRKACQPVPLSEELLIEAAILSGDTPQERRLQKVLTQAAAALSKTAGVPDVLFDGYAVYQGMTDEARARINAGGVSDVLDSVVRLIRAQAAPSASGGDVWTREMVADAHKRGEELFQRINPTSAAAVSERARELADEWRHVLDDGEDGHELCASRNTVARFVNAIDTLEQALTQQRGHGTTGSMEQAEKATFVPCDCGCGRSCCAMCGNDVGFLTPQPSADAVRELVKRAVSALTSHDQFNWALADPTLVDDLNSIMEGRTDA